MTFQPTVLDPTARPRSTPRRRLGPAPEPTTLQSYSRHVAEEDTDAAAEVLPSCYGDPDCVDNWHHARMLESLRPLLQAAPAAKWLTVGDGKFGSNAFFLKPYVAEVTASSISDSTLRIAKERGWVDAYARQNAEALGYEDDSFDFVLCKEAYHHFPRPPVGFYEMFRVARSALVLIEPQDGEGSALNSLKRAVKRLLRPGHAFDLFEPSGNFVFRLNVEEAAKMMIAMNCEVLAYREMNVFFFAPVAGARKGPASPGYWIMKAGLFLQDLACAVGLLRPGMVTLVCFKTAPAETVLQGLRAGGFRIRSLPKNPYV